MTLRNAVTPAEMVDYLNGLLDLDRAAVAALVANRVPCNREMADHPTAQVGVQHGAFWIGLLGLLNGAFGVLPDDSPRAGCGAVVAIFEDDPGAVGARLSHFIVEPEWPA